MREPRVSSSLLEQPSAALSRHMRMKRSFNLNSQTVEAGFDVVPILRPDTRLGVNQITEREGGLFSFLIIVSDESRSQVVHAHGELI